MVLVGYLFLVKYIKYLKYLFNGNLNNMYKSTHYYLSRYFSYDIVGEIQKLLLPNKIFDFYNILHNIIHFYKYKRYISRNGYLIKYNITSFNEKKQINSSTKYNFYRKYCIKCNKSLDRCLHKSSSLITLYQYARGLNLLLALEGNPGLRYVM